MKLGLALGGGGARGAAHIGIYMEMLRLGLRPDLITGTSIGGLVGALIACGLNPPEIIQFFHHLDAGHLFALPGNHPSLAGNVKYRLLLEETIGRPTFADLQIPLAVVATDLVRRVEVVLDEGDVITALLATTAFPVILPPVQRDELILIDGGVLNNVPFDIARARGATRVIAVDLTNTAPYGTAVQIPAGPGLVARALALTQRQPIWQVLSSLVDILTTQSVNARLAISPPDVLLRPEIGTIGLFDFHRLEEGIAAGQEAVLAAEPALQELLATPGPAVAGRHWSR